MVTGAFVVVPAGGSKGGRAGGLGLARVDDFRTLGPGGCPE